jgi:hypothetical protein
VLILSEVYIPKKNHDIELIKYIHMIIFIGGGNQGKIGIRTWTGGGLTPVMMKVIERVMMIVIIFAISIYLQSFLYKDESICVT